MATWHRLHPLSPLIRAGRIFVGAVIIFAGTLTPGSHNSITGVVSRLVIGVLVIGFGAVSWLVTRWRIDGNDLRIETGLIRRSSLRFPLAQIQAIDVVRPALARVFGLAELRLRMGGATAGHARLAYLTAKHADAVRAQLLTLARGESRAADQPSEHVLATVPLGRLAASIVLDTPTLVFAVMVIAFGTMLTVSPEAAVGILSSSGAVVIGMATFYWRRLNGAFNLTVAEAHDGLRLRSGLLDTTAETIPSGRVQAVRMVEPVLWRPLGWCRLEVDVAGRQHSGGEGSPERRQLHALLPVGTREEAGRLLERILPGAPAERSRPPRRAWWKAPLRYHNLSWGHDARCAVTTSGRFARVTSWVPLRKVQSLRLVQGPVQRRLRLATIFLDTAGRSVHAAIRDRDAEEARAQLAELTVLSRSARSSQMPLN